jgi:hypothetical protein
MSGKSLEFISATDSITEEIKVKDLTAYLKKKGA